MTRSSSLLAWALCAALSFGVLGCGVAFRSAMERGDAAAQTGSWDAAAASYERAVQLDPESPEARAKLQKARSKQAAVRAAGSRWHLQRGELVLAVGAARQALALDPGSQEARAAFDEAKKAALDRVEALLTEDKLQDALELARAVRRYDRMDQRAADLEARCLDTIAAKAYDRAIAFLAQKKLGNALLALREVEAARPGYRDVGARMAATQGALEDEIRFLLVVERAAPADRTPLAARIEESLLAWQPDKRFRLSAATDRDPPQGAQAVRVQPRVSAVERAHSMSTFARSCDYVCGVDRVANPAHDVASRRATEAERRKHAAENAATRSRRVLDRAKLEAPAAATALTAAEAAERTAESELNLCRTKKKPGATCSAEEARVDAAKRAHDAAETRDTKAKQALASAESDAREAEVESEAAKTDWEASLRRLQSTPTTVLVDRVCQHNYGVEVHTFSASTMLKLGAHVVGEPAPVDLPPKVLPMSVTDEAFPAQAGRCIEVAAGDPLRPPSEMDIEVTLASRAVVEIQAQVATWYAGYVESYRADYESAKAAGRAEDANEAYVRYLLVGPGLNAR